MGVHDAQIPVVHAQLQHQLVLVHLRCQVAHFRLYSALQNLHFWRALTVF